MIFLKGIGALILALAGFSLFSLKFPRGDKAMGGLADAAVATFLVEAILKYICGDFLGIEFLGNVGAVAGEMAAVAAAALVGLSMGTNPTYALAAAAAVAPFEGSGLNILSGFIAAYVLHFVLKKTVRYLPSGLDVIVGALLSAILAFGIAHFVNAPVISVIQTVGASIEIATEQSAVLMGIILGGLMKMICTSPLSAMALTAMLGLTGLPMGIAAIACFGGCFADGVTFKRLKLGDKGSVLGVMLEPLTQAHIVTKNPIPIYCTDFMGGALAGLVAALLGIVNNAPGTSSPVPGMLAPFAFNAPGKVVLALVLAAIGGIVAGFIGSTIFLKLGFGNKEVQE